MEREVVTGEGVIGDNNDGDGTVMMAMITFKRIINDT